MNHSIWRSQVIRPHHSTETALIRVLNDIRLNTDSGKVSVLVLLDLSAAFDTVRSQYIVEQFGNLGRTQRNSPEMVQVLLGRAELFCDHWKL